MIIQKQYIEGGRQKIRIICKKHGEFYCTAGSHIGMKTGCPTCSSSKGEIAIEDFFLKNNMKYEKQKRFKDCRDKLPLPFDFYLPDFNLCIEYDGRQHFEPQPWSRTNKHAKQNMFYELSETQRRDQIKTDYCKNNNINLLRIPYNKFNKIEKILIDYLKKFM